MSEATVKALTDAIYDAIEGSDPVRELDNEQVYEVARLAAQTIEFAGTTKVIIRAWLDAIRMRASDLEWWASMERTTELRRKITHWAEAIREVSS